jgi:hypothetical protein
MDNPFKRKPDAMVAIAHAAMPILVDRLGGTVTVSEVDLAALSERYGGAVAVTAEQVKGDRGAYRLTHGACQAEAQGGRAS